MDTLSDDDRDIVEAPPCSSLPALDNHLSLNTYDRSAQSESTSYPASIATQIDEAEISRQTLCGMLLVAIGTVLFCSIGAMMQYHGGSVLQLMLGRYLVQNVLSWMLWCCNPCRVRGTAVHWFGDVPHRKNIWIRGLLFFLTTLFWWRGLGMVPLGDGEAILFLSPITTVIAARYFLGEALPTTFFLTTILNATGLVFICRPTMVFGHTQYTSHPLSWEGVLFLFTAVIVWSTAVILTRTAKEAHWMQLELSTTTQSVLIWCPLLIVLSKYVLKSDIFSDGVDPEDWDYSLETGLTMVAMGVLGFLALMCNVVGFQMGDTTKVAWMQYLDLVFVFVNKWCIFNETPSMWDMVGCALLLSACLVNIAEEWVRYKRSGNGQEQSVPSKGMDGVRWDIVDLSNLQNQEIVDREREPLLTSILYFDAKAMGFRMNTEYSPDPD